MCSFLCEKYKIYEILYMIQKKVKTIAFACFFWMPEKWDFNFVSDFLLVFYVVFHKNVPKIVEIPCKRHFSAMFLTNEKK